MFDQALLEQCSSAIAAKNLTIAFAESATGGKLAFCFSQTAHSGEILKGGIVCYNACIKEDILGISKKMIGTYTPESSEVTQEMAVRTRKLMNADISVAVTGLPSPGGSEHPGKPVGTMFYCIATADRITERRQVFTGAPEVIIDLTIDQIVKTLLHVLHDDIS